VDGLQYRGIGPFRHHHSLFRHIPVIHNLHNSVVCQSV
jgi:hypothetical protein